MVLAGRDFTKHYYAGAWRVYATLPDQHLLHLPYGENYVREHTASPYSERFTFTGKEKDSESGYHYFGARYYDSEVLTGWLSVDPMADKYPSLSPYNYCAWNPVKLVDPDGDSVAVLFAGNAVIGLGHLALLIQHEDNKWYLYSKNGDNGEGGHKTVSGVVVGTDDDSPLTDPETGESIKFNSVEEFLKNTQANTEKHDGQGGPYYTEAYILPTSAEQDKVIRNSMKRELGENYHLIFNNCSEAVVSALSNVRIRTSQSAYGDSMNCSYQAPVLTVGLIPRITFAKIKHLNPHGASVQ